MNDREKWRERVRDIRASDTTWWWWWWWGLFVWSRLDDPFVSKNPRAMCAYHSPGYILDCAHSICVNMVKFQFLTLFPANHLPHPILSCFIVFLSWFVVFAYHSIDRFVSTTPSPTFAILFASYLFLLWYNWFLWCCTVLLSEKIKSLF